MSDWIIGFFAFLVLLLGGFLQVEQSEHQNTKKSLSELNQKIKELSDNQQTIENGFVVEDLEQDQIGQTESFGARLIKTALGGIFGIPSGGSFEEDFNFGSSDYYRKPTRDSVFWDIVHEKDDSLRFVDEIALFVDLDQEQQKRLMLNHSSQDEENEKILSQVIGQAKYNRFKAAKEEIEKYNQDHKQDEYKLILARRFDLDQTQVETLVSALEDINQNLSVYSKTKEDKQEYFREKLEVALTKEQIEKFLKCQEKYLSDACQTWSWYKTSSSIEHSFW